MSDWLMEHSFNECRRLDDFIVQKQLALPCVSEIQVFRQCDFEHGFYFLTGRVSKENRF